MIDTILRRLLFVAASAFLASGAWLAVETIRSERAITKQTISSEKSITSSVNGLPAMANTHLVAIEAKVDAVTQLTSGAIATIDKRLASVQKDANVQLTTANQSIAAVAGAVAKSVPSIAKSSTDALASVSADFHQVAMPIAGTAAQLNDAAPLYLDCEFNADCAFNRFQGVSKATERTMQAIAKAAPQMAADSSKIEGSVSGIADDVKREADELVKPKTFRQKLNAYLFLAAEVAAHLI